MSAYLYRPTFAIFVRENQSGNKFRKCRKNIGASDQQIYRGANTRERESTTKKQKRSETAESALLSIHKAQRKQLVTVNNNIYNNSVVDTGVGR